MEKKKFSWEEIDRFADELVSKVQASGFMPDYLVGIAVGGLIPLGLLAKKLDSNAVLTVSASSYNDANQKTGEPTVWNLPTLDLSNKKILIVDEIAETGETLEAVKKVLIEKCNAGDIKTAVLGIHKKKCMIVPDFYIFAEEVWIVFPWEER